MNKKRDVIAVDLGGTNLRIGIVRNNKIIEFVKMPTPKTADKILNALFENIGKLISKRVKGIGIASPGPLVKGVIKNSPNLPFVDFDLKNAVKKKFKIRVEVENDAKCVALAEARFGVKKKNFFVLTMGTGVGGGVIINNKLYDAEGPGSELGHIYLTPEKSFEELVGIKAIYAMSKKKFGREFNIGELAGMNNQRARAILEELAGYCAQGIGSIINVFNPEIVVLAGGARHGGDVFLEMIRKKVKKYIILPQEFDIVWTKLEHPGTLGAALLVD